MPEEKSRTRRHLLKSIARGLPAIAAGGALAHIGLAGRKRKASGDFAGDPADWRRKFLTEALAEKGASPAVDTIAPPVKISTHLPLVTSIGEDGFIPLSAPVPPWLRSSPISFGCRWS